jgi:hypothetical protein
MPELPADNRLLVTMTHEPFQPVRLCYGIPSRTFVTERLATLGCVVEDRETRSWQWLYRAEASSLEFFAGFHDVPPEVQPVILGRLRFPKSGGMTFQLNSTPRAIAAARFFGPLLGPDVVLHRCRVVNRCFAAAEATGDPEALLKTLDQNVTIVDPAKREARFAESFKGVKTLEDAERASTASLARRLKEKDDVPPVEDFPLCPEEETPNFDSLAMTLQLRLVQARIPPRADFQPGGYARAIEQPGHRQRPERNGAGEQQGVTGCALQPCRD